MTKFDVIALLNELLALEQRQLSLRFTESTCFVTRLSVDEAQFMQRLCESAKVHGELLSEAVVALGGTPGLRVGERARANRRHHPDRGTYRGFRCR